jgi:hypothetical protein
MEMVGVIKMWFKRKDKKVVEETKKEEIGDLVTLHEANKKSDDTMRDLYNEWRKRIEGRLEHVEAEVDFLKREVELAEIRAEIKDNEDKK